MCTQRPFTSQVISKIYFLTFASYIEKLPETTIKNKTKQNKTKQNKNNKYNDQCWYSLVLTDAISALATHEAMILQHFPKWRWRYQVESGGGVNSSEGKFLKW